MNPCIFYQDQMIQEYEKKQIKRDCQAHHKEMQRSKLKNGIETLTEGSRERDTSRTVE